MEAQACQMRGLVTKYLVLRSNPAPNMIWAGFGYIRRSSVITVVLLEAFFSPRTELGFHRENGSWVRLSIA